MEERKVIEVGNLGLICFFVFCAMCGACDSASRLTEIRDVLKSKCEVTK